MGQRLNIEIVNGETSLANCYYHWSAYTGSALALTREVIDAYYDSESIVSVKMAVELFEATGGGINEEERALVQNDKERFGHIEFKNAINRNKGLISVTEEQKEITRTWEEGRVTIDLNSETFAFSVIWEDTPEEFMSEYPDLESSDLDNFVKCKYDLSAVPFDEIEGLIALVKDNPDGVIGEDGFIIHWVE